MKFIKLKKTSFYCLIFMISNLIHILSPKAMQEGEYTSEHQASRIILLEDVMFGSNSHIDSQHAPSLSSLSFQSEEETSSDTSLVDRPSSSYVAAFQKELNEGISRSEAFRYIICLVGGIGPFIPQIAISKAIAHDYNSKLLGYTLITASAISIEAITSWMIWELIDDTQNLIDLVKQKNNPFTCNYNVLKGMGIGLSSLILGVLSSAPDVYIKYIYNDIKWLVLISLIYDSIPRVIGFYKFFSSLELESIRKILKGPSIEERRATKIINISQAYFLQKCKEDGVENTFNTLSNFSSPRDIYSYLTSNAQLDFTEENSPNEYAKGLPRKGVKYSSILLPTASALFNSVMAYQGFKSIIKNETALFLLSAFSVMPTFFLSSYVVMESSGSVFDKIYLSRSRTPSTDYFSTFYPKTNIALFSSALLLASITSFTSFNIIADNLEGTILDSIKYGIAALAVGTDFTFGTYTIYSTFKRYGEVILRKANTGASYVINCTKKLGTFSNSISSFSSGILNKFFRNTITEEEI